MLFRSSAGVTQPLDTDNPLGGLWAVNIEGPLYHGSFEPLAALLDSFLGTDGPVPQLVIDAPGGGGKIPLNPAYVLRQDHDGTHLRNYEGKEFLYPENREIARLLP